MLSILYELKPNEMKVISKALSNVSLLALLLFFSSLTQSAASLFPRVIVVTTFPLPPLVAPLLQQLRIKEEESLLSPIGIALDEKALKKLRKAVGEEFNELVATPLSYFLDEKDRDINTNRSRGKESRALIVCCSSELFSSEEKRSPLASLAKAFRLSSGSLQETRLSELLQVYAPTTQQLILCVDTSSTSLDKEGFLTRLNTLLKSSSSSGSPAQGRIISYSIGSSEGSRESDFISLLRGQRDVSVDLTANK